MFHGFRYDAAITGFQLYHLESRWRNSHVLVYHGPLLSDLLGVAPSTFTMVYRFSNLGTWLYRLYPCSLHLLRTTPEWPLPFEAVTRHPWKIHLHDRA